MNLEFKKIDAKILEATAAQWREEMDQNSDRVSVSFYEAQLEWCERNVGGDVVRGDGDGAVWGVFADGSSHALGVVTLEHARRRTSEPHLKMLNFTVAPHLNLAEQDQGAVRSTLSWVAAKAIVGALELTYTEYSSSQLKIFCAVPLDREFMGALESALFGISGLQDAFHIEFQGNWWVATKK